MFDQQLAKRASGKRVFREDVDKYFRVTQIRENEPTLLTNNNTPSNNRMAKISSATKYDD